MGTDIQGVSTLPESDPQFQVEYPFKSFDGQVTFTKPKTGDRTFDYSSEGVAHYGLLAEWVQNLQKSEANVENKAIESFMKSAEAYLQMWERASSH